MTQYKDRDITTLKNDVAAFIEAQEMAAIAAYKSYTALRKYFLLNDVRAYYLKFKPVDEAELTAINNLHAVFIQSWPKDIRGERSFAEGQIQFWTNHRNIQRDAVKSKRKRVENMDPAHPKKAVETQELAAMKTVTLPMAEQELDQLRAFLAALPPCQYDFSGWISTRCQTPALMVALKFRERPAVPYAGAGVSKHKAAFGLNLKATRKQELSHDAAFERRND